MPVHDQLLGSTQPVLSISLEPGESIVAETAEFAWMTDSIQMAAGPAGLSAYTAKDSAGTIAFASRLPGSIVCLEISPDAEYLVHRRGLPGGHAGDRGHHRLPAAAAHRQPSPLTSSSCGASAAAAEPGSSCLATSSGATWSPGTFAAHASLAHRHLRGIGRRADGRAARAAASHLGNDAHHFAVLSGPGSVWLQSMPLLGAPVRSLAAGPARGVPAVEGAAGPARGRAESAQAPVPHRTVTSRSR